MPRRRGVRTWGRNLGQHIHVHCIVTDGALSPDRERWLTPVRRGFLFPTTALSKVFRGKYLDFLTAAYRSGELRMPGDDGLDDTRAFESLKTSLQSNDWVVYTQAPFAGAANVLAYLGRYTHKTAIANHRLVDFDAEQVRFRWRDYARGNKLKVMRLDADEFIRRFLLHVLPRRFTRLRHYGLLGNRGRARKLALCRTLLAQPTPEPREPETPQAMMLLPDWDRHHCVSAVRTWSATSNSPPRTAQLRCDARSGATTTMTSGRNRQPSHRTRREPGQGCPYAIATRTARNPANAGTRRRPTTPPQQRRVSTSAQVSAVTFNTLT